MSDGRELRFSDLKVVTVCADERRLLLHLSGQITFWLRRFMRLAQLLNAVRKALLIGGVRQKNGWEISGHLCDYRM